MYHFLLLLSTPLLSLNQNLTLSYDDTSYSGQQDINSTLQAILEKVFPNKYDINALPNGKFEVTDTRGTASVTGYNPLKFSANGSSYIRIRTVDSYDVTNLSQLRIKYTNTGQQAYPPDFIVWVGSVNRTIPANTETVIDLSTMSGEQQIQIQAGRGGDTIASSCTVNIMILE